MGRYNPDWGDFLFTIGRQCRNLALMMTKARHGNHISLSQRAGFGCDRQNARCEGRLPPSDGKDFG
jgi:hypothetical protein